REAVAGAVDVGVPGGGTDAVVVEERVQGDRYRVGGIGSVAGGSGGPGGSGGKGGAGAEGQRPGRGGGGGEQCASRESHRTSRGMSVLHGPTLGEMARSLQSRDRMSLCSDVHLRKFMLR